MERTDSCVMFDYTELCKYIDPYHITMLINQKIIHKNGYGKDKKYFINLKEKKAIA